MDTMLEYQSLDDVLPTGFTRFTPVPAPPHAQLDSKLIKKQFVMKFKDIDVGGGVAKSEMFHVPEESTML